MLLRIRLLGLFLIFIQFVTYSQNRVSFKSLTIEDGLSQSTVNCILQDKQGFMWFGTEDALNKYDGYSFTIFRPEPSNINSISDNFIKALAEDSVGNIWIATNRGVNCFYKDSENFESFEDNMQIGSSSHLVINDIVVDENNDVWIASEGNGIFVYSQHNKSFKNYKFNEENSLTLSSNSVVDVFFDKRTGVWAITDDGKLNHFISEKDGFESFTLTHNHKIVKLSCVYISGDGSIWLGTDGFGIFRYDFDNNSFVSNSFRNSYEILGASINGIIEDKSNNLWIATEGKGIYLYNRKEGKVYNYFNNPIDNSSLSHDVILSAFVDDANIVWFGTDLGGVNYYDPNRIKFDHYSMRFDSEFVLSHNMVYSVFMDNETNILYVGTYGGWINKLDFNNGTIKYLRVFPKDRSKVDLNTIYIIKKDSDGNILIGSKFGGLHVCNPSNDYIKPFNLPNNILASYVESGVRTLETDEYGNIWIGTLTKGLVKYNTFNQKFDIIDCKPNNQPNNHVHNKIYSLLLDKSRMLWVGTDGGGIKLLNPVNNEIEHFMNNELDTSSLCNDYVSSIYEDKDKNIWIGTLGGGLSMFERNNKRFLYYNKQDGLSDMIYGVLPGNIDKELWLSTTIGLFRFNTETIEAKRYTTEDGLQSNEFNGGAFYRAKNGRLFFGGINGINAFFPNEVKDNYYKPQIQFTNLQINYKNIDQLEDKPTDIHISQSKSLSLRYYQDVFTISFSAMHFSCPERIEYAYKMEGFDNDWHYIGNSNSATFTNLDAGKYTLYVKATNSDCIWNESPQKIEIRIKPPFWKTSVFRIFEALAVMVLIALFILIRERRLRRRKIILEKLVKQRTIELRKQKEEIETQRDEITAQRDEIVAQRDSLEVYNKELLEQKEEIMRQRDEIEMHRNQMRQRNKNITDSILYAEKIQNVILPSDDKIRKLFPESFIFYKPKDIVSGDFYWFEEKGSKKFFSAVDCTGHGVPGALMSIVCHNMLNEAVNIHRLSKPADILRYLSENVSENFKTKEKNTDLNDGMDLALCVYDSEKNILEYSGAFNPLYIIRNGNLLMYQPDCHSINVFNENRKEFRNHTIKLNDGDLLYLFTDGYIDQFGGIERKKFLKRRFKETLKSIHKLPLEKQKENLSSIFNNWKKGYDQIDDVLVLGIRINYN